jgi:hypothetical protein
MTEVVECLLSKHKALSSSSSITHAQKDLLQAAVDIWSIRSYFALFFQQISFNRTVSRLCMYYAWKEVSIIIFVACN